MFTQMSIRDKCLQAHKLKLATRRQDLTAPVLDHEDQKWQNFYLDPVEMQAATT